MISWITIVILSAPRRSTSGRAPWFRAIIRFWIRVESLNRPPTLLTISSSFSSSSIAVSASATVLDQEIDEPIDRAVEVVVDEDHVVAVRMVALPAGADQAAMDGRVVFRPSAAKPLLQLPEPRGVDEQEERRRRVLPD